jgi:hypothetical protein
MLIVAVRAYTGRPGGDQLLAPWLVFAALMAASIVAAMLLASGPAGPLVMLVVITLASGGAAAAVLRGTSEVGAGAQPSAAEAPVVGAPTRR